MADTNMSVDDLLKEFGTTQETKNGNEPNIVPLPEGSIDEKVGNGGDVKNPFESFSPFIDEKLFKGNILNTYTTNEDGSEYFIPKTEEEFIELLKANKEQWIEEARLKDKNAILEEIFETSTPAMKFLAENANRFNRVDEMFELAQSVQFQDDLANLDLADENHQELIIRNALNLQGLDSAAIDSEIEDLRERDRLAIRAEQLKPLLDNHQAAVTENILHQAELKKQEEQQFWSGYYNNLQNVLLAKGSNIDGINFKEEDRTQIASLLLPLKEGGLPIYLKIDEAVGRGDIETLSLIGMLLNNKESFYDYIHNRDSTGIAKGLQKVLRSVGNKSQQQNFEKIKPVEKTFGSFLPNN